MTHAEYRYRLLLTGSMSLLVLTLGALIGGSTWVGNLFVASVVMAVGAVILMPAPRRSSKKREDVS